MDHELRKHLNDELHNRAGQPVRAPSRISYLAFVLSGNDAHLLQHINVLCDHLAMYRPAPGEMHFAAAFSQGHFRFERHGEFYRISVTVSDSSKSEAIEQLPIDWLAALPGERLVAIHTHVQKSNSKPVASAVQKFFGHDDVAGSVIGQGQARVWMDFRIGKNGFSRILVEDIDMEAKRLGRVLRRIHEIETYRMMALLTLPLARSLAPKIHALEAGLDNTIAAMARVGEAGADSNLLSELTRISRDAEELSSKSAYRFSAAQAYATLVGKRIQELNEDRIQGHQRVGVFLDRRFSPAIATCKVVAERISSLTQRCERAGNLLRTRVDIALEDQNQKLLGSMNERALLQLRLQETVEGLSIVAISYYAVSLLTKLKEDWGTYLPVEISKGIGMILIPVVVVTVWLALRRIRRRVSEKK